MILTKGGHINDQIKTDFAARLDGFSQRKIEGMLKVSLNTVTRVVNACDALPINEQELQAIDESGLHQHLFPKEKQIPVITLPDYDHIHKELLLC
ncbi:MAG: hypothetical protein RBR35_19740 [Salinivirgaceae bacterium]|nr:hypothetical protein [Salinivirgaceae bacterium]